MTPRMSMRAQAQEIYREMAAPTLTLPRERGREQAVRGEGEPSAVPAVDDLTAHVRALYEGSAVPVREIAVIAGVTERTLYKYAAKLGWKPRYRWTVDGARPRGARRQRAEGFAPVKGAGGRFIRREDEGQPFATRLKATDPAGRARGLAACGEAAAQAEAAEREAREMQRFEARLRAIDQVIQAAGALNGYVQSRRGRPRAAADPVAHAQARLLKVSLDCWEALRGEEKAR